MGYELNGLGMPRKPGMRTNANAMPRKPSIANPRSLMPRKPNPGRSILSSVRRKDQPGDLLLGLGMPRKPWMRTNANAMPRKPSIANPRSLMPRRPGWGQWSTVNGLGETTVVLFANEQGLQTVDGLGELGDVGSLWSWIHDNFTIKKAWPWLVGAGVVVALVLIGGAGVAANSALNTTAQTGGLIGGLKKVGSLIYSGGKWFLKGSSGNVTTLGTETQAKGALATVEGGLDTLNSIKSKYNDLTASQKAAVDGGGGGTAKAVADTAEGFWTTTNKILVFGGGGLLLAGIVGILLYRRK